MNKEDQIRLEAGMAWVEIDQLIMKTRAEQQAAHQELDDLNRRLPRMLLGMVMGDVSRNEVRAVKVRIVELREILQDIPIILQELEVEKSRRCFRPLQEAFSLSKDREGGHARNKARILECH